MLANAEFLLTSRDLDGTFPRRAASERNSAGAYCRPYGCWWVQPRRRSIFAPRRLSRRSRPLDGENIHTNRWEDARHWISIYADLLQFKRGLLDRVRREITKLPPVAGAAAELDLRIIEAQMNGYEQRLELWYRRVWDLHGLWLEPKGRTIHYKTETSKLTEREFQLLQFLLDHPHRYFSVPQILGQAWGNPDLYPEEARTYIRRLRRLLAALHVPCDIVNRPHRGYSLIFRGTE